MSKRQFLCLLGVWVMIFLFLGFPSSWHKPIAIISGVVIVWIAYTLPPATSSTGSSTSSIPSSRPSPYSQETFVENKQQ